MAITWYKRSDDDLNKFEVKGVTHEGLVLDTAYRSVERVTSDEYADVFYVLVWNEKKSEPERIRLGTNYHRSVLPADAVVDAPADIMEAWADYSAEQERLRKEAEAKAAEARRIAALKEPRKGRKVTVVRGRKVAKGTTGFVFWDGPGRYGWRVGIATSMRRDDEGNFADVVWTAASNCDAEIGDINSEAAVETRLAGWKQARLDAIAIANDRNNAKAKQVTPCDVPF